MCLGVLGGCVRSCGLRTKRPPPLARRGPSSFSSLPAQVAFRLRWPSGAGGRQLRWPSGSDLAGLELDGREELVVRTVGVDADRGLGRVTGVVEGDRAAQALVVDVL